MHVDTEARRPVGAGVGKVLETITGAKSGQGGEGKPGGRNDLHGSAEILHAELVIGEKRQARTHVDRQSAASSGERHGRYDRAHEAAGSGCRELSRAADQTGFYSPKRGRPGFPTPRKPPQCGDVVQVEIFLLLLTERGVATHAEPWSDPGQGHRGVWIP